MELPDDEPTMDIGSDFEELAAKQAHAPDGATGRVLREVAEARAAEDAIEGYFRDYADATQDGRKLLLTAEQRSYARLLARAGRRAWSAQLMEVMAEVQRGAFGENTPALLRAALVRMAALTVAWICALDARAAEQKALAFMKPEPWWRRLVRRWWGSVKP